MNEWLEEYVIDYEEAAKTVQSIIMRKASEALLSNDVDALLSKQCPLTAFEAGALANAHAIAEEFGMEFALYAIAISANTVLALIEGGVYPPDTGIVFEKAEVLCNAIREGGFLDVDPRLLMEAMANLNE